MTPATPLRPEPLLRTKLFAPTRHATWVTRARLSKQLNESLRFGHKLILISAPPGFGKTTIVTEWLAQACEGAANARISAAWYALDEGDNDLARFIAYLYSTLVTLGGSNADWQELRALLQISPLPAVETLLVAALNVLQSDSSDAPRVLVLEDYHVIHNVEIHRALSYWLDHMPPGLHLVITSRADPPLPLARLRARMQLTELRAADLRFTAEEAAAFLKQTMDLALTPAQIATLEERTEGWIAGLQLAALSLQKDADVDSLLRAFTGTHRYIMDYLVEEVLQHEPESVQTFLLHTSVLDRFNASLCDAVAPGNGGASGQLDYLERRNLFIIPLDGRREWYRYHQLFAQVLRQRLRRLQPEHIAVVYARASEWFHANALTHEAIQYALTAQAYDRAAEWIARSADEMLLQGEHATLLRWLEALPNATLDAHPELWLARARAFVISHALDQAENALERTQRAIAHLPAHGERVVIGAIETTIAAIGTTIALNRGDAARALSLGKQALEKLDAGDAATRGSVLLHMGVAYDWLGLLDNAVECFAESRRLNEEAEKLPGALLAISNLGAAEKTRARYHRAAEIFRQGMTLDVTQKANYLPGAIYLYTDLSELLYEWNDLSGARPMIDQVIERSELLGLTRVRVTGYRLLARWLYANGKTAEALQTIAQAIELAREHKIPDHYSSPARALQVVLWLNTGDMQRAREWAQTAGPDIRAPFDKPRQEEYLALARVHLAHGEPARAQEILEYLIDDAEPHGRTESVIWARAILALAYHALNQNDAAIATLARALALAEPQNFVRTFLDLGEPMRGLLLTIRQRIDKISKPEATRDYLNRLIATATPPHAPAKSILPVPARVSLPPEVEPLTDRELQVLRLVAHGLSDKQVAAQLIVATGTVKRHLNNIYSKLGVSSRTQALARAREIGWID